MAIFADVKCSDANNRVSIYLATFYATIAMPKKIPLNKTYDLSFVPLTTKMTKSFHSRVIIFNLISGNAFTCKRL